MVKAHLGGWDHHDFTHARLSAALCLLPNALIPQLYSISAQLNIISLLSRVCCNLHCSVHRPFTTPSPTLPNISYLPFPSFVTLSNSTKYRWLCVYSVLNMCLPHNQPVRQVLSYRHWLRGVNFFAQRLVARELTHLPPQC